MMSGVTRIGMDIGQRKSHTAICVAEAEWREKEEEEGEVHFDIRHLERLSLGAPFPEVAARLAEVAQTIEQRTVRRPCAYANLTRLGAPVLDLLRKEGSWVVPVYFNYGDQRSEEKESWGMRILLGKAFLVSRLQTLLQTGRLHLPKTDEASKLSDDLLAYEITVVEDANDRYGAFRVGPQDDLITALGLAVQVDPACRPSTRVDLSSMRKLPGADWKELMDRFLMASW